MEVEKVNEVLCGPRSKIGDVAEWLVGEAKHCWCCAFFRGFLFGAIAGACVAGAIALAAGG